jgi:hypothetical protein
VSVTRLRDPLARAYLAARWRTEPDASRALQDALADDFAAGVEVVLDRDPFPPSPAGTAASGDGAQGKATAEEVTVTDGRGTPGRVRRALWKPSSARFDLELAREAVLVVTDTWFPGWRAELDGRSVPLLRANGYQRAVAVPRGPHTVTLAYRPASLSRGAWISVSAALVLSLLGAARGRGRGRRAAAPAAGNEVALDGVGPAGGREPREARAGTGRTPLGDDSFTEGSVGYEPASGRPLEAGRGADDRP